MVSKKERLAVVVFLFQQIDSSFLPDVNECEETNGGCEALCCNTIGSFYCRCPPGLKLNEDGKSCQGESSAVDFPGSLFHR